MTYSRLREEEPGYYCSACAFYGNLKSVEYADRLGTLHIPTLIVVGDHDECDPTLSREMNALIPKSKLVILPKSGHLTFVDQNGMFLQTVGDFVR